MEVNISYWVSLGRDEGTDFETQNLRTEWQNAILYSVLALPSGDDASLWLSLHLSDQDSAYPNCWMIPSTCHNRV